MTDNNAPEIVIATSDATVTVGGAEVQVRKDSSTAFASDPIVRDNPDLWTKVEPVYDESEGEPRDVVHLDADHDDEPAGDTFVSRDDIALTSGQPAAKDVRAWAKDNSIDVPAKGPIPADVIERYKAAHG
jgi:hypothetical protein